MTSQSGSVGVDWGIGKAAGVAVAVLLLSGLGYRLAAAKYAQISTSTPLPAGTLARIPVQIGDWKGRDVELDPAIIKFTDTDDRLNRLYRNRRDTVNLYVAYGVRIRDLAPHRPEICYVGAGYLLDRRKEMDLKSADGTTLPVQIQTFTRGELQREQVTVLNYYLVNGVYSADVSGLRRQAMRLDRSHSYSVQVQITSSGASEPAETAVRAFAEESAPAIRDLIVSAVKAQATRPADAASKPGI
jgi:EpsI family protein